MDKADNTSILLAALAHRLRNNPDFMAYDLARYQEMNDLDDLALSKKLGTLPEMVIRLALCKRPQRNSPYFADQIRELSDYTLIDEVLLEGMIRPMDKLSESARSLKKTGTGLLPVRQAGWLATALHRAGAIIRAHSLIFASVISILLLFAASNLWREYTNRHQSSILSNSTAPVATDSETPSSSESSSQPAYKDERLPKEEISPARPSRGSSLKRQKLIAQVSIDLEEYTRLRESGVEERPINIPQSRVRLLLNMPEGSSRGLYDVSIVDAFGKPLLSKKASNPDGKSLRITLDTSGLQERKYILCLSREEEIPDCYTLLISGTYSAIQQEGNF
jgi:hypothetical protein